MPPEQYRAWLQELSDKLKGAYSPEDLWEMRTTDASDNINYFDVGLEAAPNRPQVVEQGVRRGFDRMGFEGEYETPMVDIGGGNFLFVDFDEEGAASLRWLNPPGASLRNLPEAAAEMAPSLAGDALATTVGALTLPAIGPLAATGLAGAVNVGARAGMQLARNRLLRSDVDRIVDQRQGFDYLMDPGMAGIGELIGMGPAFAAGRFGIGSNRMRNRMAPEAGEMVDRLARAERFGERAGRAGDLPVTRAQVTQDPNLIADELTAGSRRSGAVNMYDFRSGTERDIMDANLRQASEGLSPRNRPRLLSPAESGGGAVRGAASVRQMAGEDRGLGVVESFTNTVSELQDQLGGSVDLVRLEDVYGTMRQAIDQTPAARGRFGDVFEVVEQTVEMGRAGMNDPAVIRQARQRLNAIASDPSDPMSGPAREAYASLTRDYYEAMDDLPALTAQEAQAASRAMAGVGQSVPASAFEGMERGDYAKFIDDFVAESRGTGGTGRLLGGMVEAVPMNLMDEIAGAGTASQAFDILSKADPSQIRSVRDQLLSTGRADAWARFRSDAFDAMASDPDGNANWWLFSDRWRSMDKAHRQAIFGDFLGGDSFDALDDLSKLIQDLDKQVSSDANYRQALEALGFSAGGEFGTQIAATTGIAQSLIPVPGSGPGLGIALLGMNNLLPGVMANRATNPRLVRAVVDIAKAGPTRLPTKVASVISLAESLAQQATRTKDPADIEEARVAQETAEAVRAAYTEHLTSTRDRSRMQNLPRLQGRRPLLQEMSRPAVANPALYRFPQPSLPGVG